MVIDVHPAFARLLRRHRLAAGLTQEALAKRAQLSVRAISDLERGVKLSPRRDTVERLSVALGLSPRERAALLVGVSCGVLGALVEAVSSHGLDNLTVQVVAAGAAALLL